MEAFTRVYRPGTIDSGNGRQVSIFCKVEYRAGEGDKPGRLSITGVEGPKSNGDAVGSCGQIDMHLREPGGLDSFQPAEGWTLESFRRFLDIWDAWHMNDTRAYDSAMKRDGWHVLARREVLGYIFTLTQAAYQARKAAEESALAALREGDPFEPSPAQFRAATRMLGFTVWTFADEPEPAPPSCPYDGAIYERERDLWGHNKGGLKHPERKTLGWLKPAEHPQGLLGKVHPESGNGYGSGWYGEEVPAEVMAELQAFPLSDRTPAWV